MAFQSGCSVFLVPYRTSWHLCFARSCSAGIGQFSWCIFLTYELWLVIAASDLLGRQLFLLAVP